MLLEGKKILIMGIRNKWSIAFGIAKSAYENGAQLLFTYMGEENKEKIEELVSEFKGSKAYVLNGASEDEKVRETFTKIKEENGKIDGIVHAIAHANTEDLHNDFIYTSKEGFAHACDVSAYSFVLIARMAKELDMLNENASLITLTYHGSTKVLEGYNVMGIAKAALESSVRYLAENLGKENIRVNAVSAGPIKTLSAKGIKDFSSLPSNNESKRKFVKLYNEFNKYLSAAIIQGYVPKDENNTDKLLKSSNQIIEETDNIEFEEMKEQVYVDQITLNSPITKESLDAIKQRYIDIERGKNENNEDIPYDIDTSLIEIDDGKIDSDYMNSKFKKYLKMLSQDNFSEEEIELALNSLHKSFASLPQEKQKYANMLIHDIESGDIIIDENKTFMDYVTEYETNAENDQIKKLSSAFGIDEIKLRNIMTSSTNESNINEFGRYEELLKTVNLEQSKNTLEKLYGKELKTYEINLKVDEILRKFILEDGFNIDSLVK